MSDARKRNHRYNASFEKEVGSDFDPNYHDPAMIEQAFMHSATVIHIRWSPLISDCR